MSVSRTSSLDGRTAVVTGANSGIGKAIALGLASHGARVAIDYVSGKPAADAVVSEIIAADGEAAAFEADVTDPEAIEHLVDRTVNRFGTLDIWVNNAGIEEKHAFLDMPRDVYRKILRVNLDGAWFGAQAAARQMVRQGRGGRIIDISSVHEELAMPTNAPYCIAKGGLRMMMRTIALELAPYGITVNNVCPGAVDTPMDAALERDPRERAQLLEEIPLRRMARPDEIASLVCFLASDDAAYVTGASYVIDGGMTKRGGRL